MGVDREAGQASLEYTGVLALVSAALAAGAIVVGWQTWAARWRSACETGICVVAGDVCRASDAAAAGLSPCTTLERARGGGASVVLASLRLGGGDELTVATRSDGTVLVTEAEDRTVGASAGLGVDASPLGIELGVEGSYELVAGIGPRVGAPGRRGGAALPR